VSEYKAKISWKLTGSDFLAGKFSREHTWSFDGGITVPASASPHVVRPPFSNPANVDPEEAFVAAVSSCHMLTFLYVAYKAGYQVESYEDDAVGIMTSNEKGIPWVSRITLHPSIVYGERSPSPEDETKFHHAAHDQCYIANSVKTEITVAE
jgi:organic hydroperoxide reductase OsmC/OhrA